MFSNVSPSNDCKYQSTACLNAEVDYVDFDVVNFDKYFGKLIKYDDKLFAGRMGFSSGEFEVIVDKRFDFTKGLDEK